MGYCFLLQGIFPTQGLNSRLPCCRQIPYCLSHHGSPGCFYSDFIIMQFPHLPASRFLLFPSRFFFSPG